jgi:hypothetical protein
MADEKPTSTISLNLSDPKTWVLIGALVGVPTAFNKLSLSTVENQQQRATETAKTASEAAVKAVETQVSIDEKLERITRFQGELSYRLEQSEKRYTELKETIEAKGKR